MESPFDGIDYPELTHLDPRDLAATLDLSNLKPEPCASLLTNSAEPQVLGGDWDKQLDIKFEELDVFESFRDHFAEGKPWEETRFYARVLREMEKGRRKWGCTKPEQYLERLYKRIDPLYECIKRDGFKTQSQLGTGNKSDEIRVAVDRKGRILFMDGRHRLAISKLLGLELVPAKIILRHAEWVDFQKSIWQYAKTSRGKIYQKIEHPDLGFFPAHHHDSRFEILRDSLDGYDCTGKALIDIGTHWGHMCHKFESLGFECFAIEKLASNIPFLRGIRDACSRRFEIWNGNIFEYPNVENMNVVLALNILHHFCKSEQLHEKLVQLLQRMKCELMFFQAHRHDPPGQMEGAYRNYNEEEFVNFVSQHTGLTNRKKLGAAADGRPIYKLWI